MEKDRAALLAKNEKILKVANYGVKIRLSNESENA